MKQLVLGILAHVDAGKTTLSEAILYLSGERRVLGRVDHGDAFLDTDPLERDRGITIFAKEARFSLANTEVTLVDTPGHVDFSAEMERTLPVLDCGILVISGSDGIQAHTLTLWQLLRRHKIPTLLFVNKMDLPGLGKEALLKSLQATLGSGCLDFTGDRAQLLEDAAVLDDGLLEAYLAGKAVTDADLAGLMAREKLFPCFFGSALKLQGVKELLEALDHLAPRKWPSDAFGARVYKIARDSQGNRMTCVKITGGSLRVRSMLSYTGKDGKPLEEKITALRQYDGAKFTAAEEVSAGMCCAILGLTGTYAGQGLGADQGGPEARLEPVMTYSLGLPEGCDPRTFLPKLRQLEEEDPQLHVTWNQRLQVIHVQLMGQVQAEILQSLILQRFDTAVTLDAGRITYKETIRTTVEGVGHYEPLRHYAEVHLLLEPLPQGSGLELDTQCSTDLLDLNWQRLILTHLAEKTHLGVLTGAPLTDVKITLMSGRAHLKHTEGGDFRQATYRAVRQGLMQAQSVLLEPWYSFDLVVPAEQIGRAITDVRAMSGEFQPPEPLGEMTRLQGRAPVSEMNGYASELAAYSSGKGRIFCTVSGYAPCHNAQAVIREADYDPEADLDNSPDSIFCAHGAGFPVKWREVPAYMHLESCMKERPRETLPAARTMSIDDRELEAIMEREFGPVKRPMYRAPSSAAPVDAASVDISPPRKKCLIVDGYNILFAWEELAALAKEDLSAARQRLLDILSNYCGFRPCELVVVFDGYKVKGGKGERFQYHNIRVVYTKEGQTGDMYIESLVHEIGKNYAVRVATSDALVQLSSFRSGVLRMSALELRAEVEAAEGQIGDLLAQLRLQAERKMSKHK